MTVRRKGGARLLAPGYATLLRLMIAQGPLTWREAADQLDIMRGTAIDILRAFERFGLAHVVEWVPVADRRRTTLLPAYRAGEGESAPHPGFANGSVYKAPKPQRVRVELQAFSNAVRALQHDTHHGRSLAAEVGVQPTTARKIIAALRAVNLAYVAEYQPRANGGFGYPLWAFGVDLPNKVKPKPAPRRELWNKHNRIKAERRRQARALGLLTYKRPPLVRRIAPSASF